MAELLHWRRRVLALGVWLSRHRSAGELQQLYLHERYFGRGAWGPHEAAQRYFGRPLETLTDGQMAFLAGLINSPHTFDPARSASRARARRDWVIQRMADDGVLTASEASAANEEPLP